MDKRFKRTEELLYDYYKYDTVIAQLSGELAIAKKQADMLQFEIKNLYFDLECSLPGLQYDKPNIMKSSSGMSPAEAEMFRQAEIKERELAQVIREIGRLQSRMSSLTRVHDRIKNALGTYDNFGKEFVRMRYSKGQKGDKMNYIARRLNVPRATLFRERERILKDMEHYLFEFVRVESL